MRAPAAEPRSAPRRAAQRGRPGGCCGALGRAGGGAVGDRRREGGRDVSSVSSVRWGAQPAVGVA